MTGNVRPETMERITTPELAQAFIEEQVKEVQAQVGDKKVLLALSGGVDSSVVAALLIKAIGKQLVCVHVNHGLMRKNESEGVVNCSAGNGMPTSSTWTPPTVSLIFSRAYPIPRESARSSARSSSTCLPTRQEN